MKKVIFKIVFLFLVKSGFTQDITLARGLFSSSNRLEFSGLAKWKTKILLLPNCRSTKSNPPIIYAIDSAKIVNSFHDHRPIDYSIIKFNSDSVNKYINQTVGVINDGFEAAVVVKNSENYFIYFAVETKPEHDVCYIMKGKIKDDSLGTTIDLIGSIPIQKPCMLRENEGKDAGYESLTFHQGELWTFFEFNDCNGRTVGYRIDTSFAAIPTPINFPQLRNNRVSDVTSVTTTQNEFLLGLNSSYNSSVGTYDIVKMDNSGIISVYNLGLNKRNEPNWEGIIPFHTGILIISDNAQGMSTVNSVLRFIQFNLDSVN